MEDDWDINPNTGQRWKRGDKREDGFTFKQFAAKKKDGSQTMVFIEDWESHKAKEQELQKKWRQNKPEKYKASQNKWKKKNPEKVKAVQRRASKKYREKNPEKAAEYYRKWSAENPEKVKALARQAQKKWRQTTQKEVLLSQKEYPKRINPLTGVLFERGDLNHANTHFFVGYGGVVSQDDYIGENWLPVGSKLRFFATNALSKAKQRANKAQLPFNLTLEYLMEIWPSDGICPVFGTDLVFMENHGEKGTRLKETASLDKFYPEKGYVKGNVAWISMRANQIKTDATTEEVEKVANWMERFEKVESEAGISQN